MMVKKMRLAAVVLAFTIATFVWTRAASAMQISVTVNGEPVRFIGIGPQQVQGRVMVPLRGVLEKLGAYVDWVPATRTVVATRGDLDIQLPLGGRTARVNGRDVPLDVPAMSMAGSTMVPLRFVGETLGASVRWNAPAQTVAIVTSGAAQAPFASPAGKPEVSSLSHNAREGWLKAGESVRVTLRGSPGASATFRIPGLAQSVSMRETSSGVYEGEWKIPTDKPVNLNSASIIAELKSGSESSPLIQSAEPIKIDTSAPKVEDFYPARNARLVKRRAPISISYSDQGSGIDRGRTKITLNRQDVTADSAITDRFLTFTPSQDLPIGKHSAEVVLFDVAGNSVSHALAFEVAERQNAVRSVSHNAGAALEPGDVLNVKVQGAPSGRARFTLGSIKDIALAESSPGEYTGSYTIKKGDDIGRAPLSVTFITKEGETFTEVAEEAVRVVTGPPDKPIITSPATTDRLANPLIVKGRGTPKTIIRLRVDYANKLLGIFALKGTAAQQDIEVKPDGTWESKPIDTSSLPTRDTEYTITVVGVGQNDERSDAVSVKIKGR
jgi:hypothetical protein